jgi:hypothetical protein
MTTNRSRTLWGIFFLLLYTGPPKFRIRDFDASLLGQYDLPVLIQIVVYLLAGFFVAREIVHARHSLPLHFTQKLAMVFLGTLGLSTLVSNSPALTLFKVYQLTVLFLFSGLFFHKFGVSHTLRNLVIGNAILCTLVVGAIPFIQEGIVELSETGFPRLRGSAIAETAIVGTFLCILLLTQQVRRNLFLLVFGSLVTFFSLARSSWGSVAIVMLLIALFKPRVWSVSFSRMAFCALALAVLVGGTVAITGRFRDPTVEDLSGRTEIWSYTTGVVLNESPWRGLGYGVASRTLVADIDPMLGSAHSVFVDVFLGGGFIALTALLLLNLVVGIDVLRILRPRQDAYAFCIAALFIVVMMLSTVGAELDSGPFGFTFFSLIWMVPYACKMTSPMAIPDTKLAAGLANRIERTQI